jgi:hypothetical protein
MRCPERRGEEREGRGMTSNETTAESAVPPAIAIAKSGQNGDRRAGVTPSAG